MSDGHSTEAAAPRTPQEAGAAPATNSAQPAHSAEQSAPQAPAVQHAAAHHPSPRRKWILGAAALVALFVVVRYLIPAIYLSFNTVSTDDAYVNGHVTFVAPRVAGQVSRVLVDDNIRVKKGALLVELDEEPFRVQVAIKQAAVTAAEAQMTAADAEVRSLIGQARSSRYKLDHAMEDVRNQLAVLASNVAQMKVAQANLVLAQQNYNRSEELVKKGAVSRQDFDVDSANFDAAKSRVNSAVQLVQQTRANLGLPINEENPLDVPADLDQTASTVREALAELLHNISQVGYVPRSWNATPQQVYDEFLKQDPEGNLDRIYAKLIPNAPLIKQAEARLLQAQRDLDEANLNLRYCKITSEIDGVVTRRNVNPGNNVQVGQSLMAIRSLTEIWIDANFKETQLADLRIGQPVKIEVDMYGSQREYEGRISGFTMGTGSTLALLPPQNATGNFVKVVQRLPVRIELTNYDPDKEPLFVGLSVTPYVYYKATPTGPHAGDILQPATALPTEQKTLPASPTPAAGAVPQSPTGTVP